MDFKAFLLAVALLFGNYFDRNWQQKENGKSNSNLVSGLFNENSSYCPMITTCMYSYRVELVNSGDPSRCCRPCQCDENCEYMKCCRDVSPCANTRVDQMNQNMVCTHTTLTTRERKNIEPGILSIATCTVKENEAELAKCQQEYNFTDADLNDVTPVSDVNSHKTYRNIHCALCNGVDLDNIKYWLLNVACDADQVDVTEESNLLKSISKTSSCYIIFNKPDSEISVKQCSFVIDSCNVTGLTDYDEYMYNETKNMCLTSSTAVKYYRGMFFKNMYCVICNGVPSFKSRSVKPDNPASFSVLLSVVSREDRNTYQPNRCEPGMLFHESKAICVEARCSPTRRLRNNACERYVLNWETFVYRVGFRLKPESTVNIADGFTMINELIAKLTNDLETVFDSINAAVYEITLISDVESHKRLGSSAILKSNLLWCEVRLKLLKSESHDPEEILETLLSLASNTKLAIVRKEGVFKFQIMLKDDTGHFSHKTLPADLSQCTYRLTRILPPPCLEVVPQYTLQAYHPNNLTAVPFIAQNKFGGQGRFYNSPISSETNILEFRKCPFIQVFKNNALWNENDLGLEFVSQRFSLYSSEFVYGENTDSIWVCLETYKSLFNSGMLYYSDAVFVVNAGTFVIAVYFCINT